MIHSLLLIRHVSLRRAQGHGRVGQGGRGGGQNGGRDGGKSRGEPPSKKPRMEKTQAALKEEHGLETSNRSCEYCLSLISYSFDNFN